MAEAKRKDEVVIEEVPHGGREIAGRIQMDTNVVATIAGLAARDIEGIYSLGRSQLIPFGTKNPKRGVAAEVGQSEAALDLDVVVEYGCDLRKVAAELRRRVATEVDRMAGRKVVEVNINVVDVHLPEPEPPPAPVKKPENHQPRVR